MLHFRLVLSSCVAAACAQELSLPPRPALVAPPVVAGIRPAAAFAGERVELTGTALGGAIDQVRVAFGDAAAVRPLEADADGTRLVVEVPASAQQGPVSIATETGRVESTAFTLRGPGRPRARRLAPSKADLRLYAWRTYPTSRTDGLIVLLGQPVRGAPRLSLALVRSDDSFDLITRDVLQAWVSPDGTFAYVTRIVARRVVLQRVALPSGDVVSTLDLRSTSQPGEEEVYVGADPEGTRIVAFSLVDLFAATWDGTALALRKTVGVAGTPSSIHPVLHVSGGRFIAMQGVGVVLVDFDSAAVFLPGWKPYGAAQYGRMGVAISKSGDVVISTLSPRRLDFYKAPAASEPFEAAGFTARESYAMPLVSNVQGLAISGDGTAAGFVSEGKFTVVSRVPVPTAIATSAIPETYSVDVDGETFLLNRDGGVTAVSARTGSPVFRAEPRALVATPILGRRSCLKNEAPAPYFAVALVAFETIVSLDPATLEPVNCLSDDVPGSGKVLAIAVGATPEERVIATARAGGGLELWRTDASGKVVGASVEIPLALVPWGPVEVENGAEIAGTDRFVQRSSDGTQLLVTWIEESNDEVTAAILPLTRLWEAGEPVNDMRIGFAASTTFLDDAGLWVFGFVSGTYDRVLASTGRLEFRWPSGFQDLVAGTAITVGDALSRRPVLALSHRVIIGGGKASLIDRKTGKVRRVWTHDLALPYRAIATPNGRAAMWFETTFVSTPYRIRTLALDPDGVPVELEPPIELPNLVAYINPVVDRGVAPGMVFTEDGARLIVTQPHTDIVYAIE